MKTPEPSEEKKAFDARIKQACLLMDDDPNLLLLREEYLTGEQNRLGSEALMLLEAAITPEHFAAAKACAIARTKIGAFQATLRSMGAAARKEADKPLPKP